MRGQDMKSKKPKKQRAVWSSAPLHKKRKWIASHLEENLLLKYDRRNIPVIKGDIVRVNRGSFKGHEDKVAHINVKKGYVEVEGLTMVKADGKKVAKPIHASNLLITKLNLTDKWRRNKLEKGLSEETKKEIEKEAEEQIREQELEEERIKEEEITKEIKEEKAEKKAIQSKQKIVEKPVERPPKEKTKKTKTKKRTTEKKDIAKKKTVKKTTTKKVSKRKKDAKTE